MEPVPQSEPVVAPVAAAVAAKPVWPSAYSLFKQSLAFYKVHSKKFFALGVVPAIISLAIALISLLVTGESSVATVALVVTVMLSFAGSVVAFAQQIAVIKSVEAFEKNETLTVKSAYDFGFHLFFSMLWVAILTVFVVWGGVLALVIPALVLSVYLSLGYFSLVLEGKKGMAALVQSMLYIKGNGWQVFGKFFYIGLVGIAVYVIGSALFILASFLITGDAMAFFFAISDKAPVSAVKTIFNLVVDVVSVMVFVPIMLVFYYHIYKQVRSLREANPITEAETAKTRRTLTIWGIVGIFAIIVFVALMIGSLYNW